MSRTWTSHPVIPTIRETGSDEKVSDKSAIDLASRNSRTRATRQPSFSATSRAPWSERKRREAEWSDESFADWWTRRRRCAGNKELAQPVVVPRAKAAARAPLTLCIYLPNMHAGPPRCSDLSAHSFDDFVEFAITGVHDAVRTSTEIACPQYTSLRCFSQCPLIVEPPFHILGGVVVSLYISIW